MEHDCIASDDDDDDMFVETRLNFVLSSFKWKWIHFISFHLCHWLEHVCIPLCVCVSISVFMFDYIFIRYGVVSRELFAICSLMISQRNTIHFPSCHSVSGMANKEHLLKEYCVCLLYFFFHFLIRKWNQKLLPFQMAIRWSAAFISIYYQRKRWFPSTDRPMLLFETEHRMFSICLTGQSTIVRIIRCFKVFCFPFYFFKQH